LGVNENITKISICQKTNTQKQQTLQRQKEQKGVLG